MEDEEETTKLKLINDPDCGDMEITVCCEVGPIINERYCPQCGLKIIRDNK